MAEKVDLVARQEAQDVMNFDSTALCHERETTLRNLDEQYAIAKTEQANLRASNQGLSEKNLATRDEIRAF